MGRNLGLVRGIPGRNGEQQDNIMFVFKYISYDGAPASTLKYFVALLNCPLCLCLLNAYRLRLLPYQSWEESL